MKKKIDTFKGNDDDQSLPVYEAELIDEEEEEIKIVPKDDKPPVSNLAYKLGKAAGSIIAVIGYFSRISHVFRENGTGREGSGKGMGRGRRQRKKNRRIR